jgi:hypothetical protein
MAQASDDRLLVLHGLRLKGFAEPESLVPLFDLDVERVRAELDALRTDGLVLYREGRLTGWALTPSGREAQETLLREELDEHGVRDTVFDAYKRFLDLNADLLGVCTAWQMRDEATLNDHTDKAYDAGVIDRLCDLHAKVEPVLTDLEDTFVRYRNYRPRLEAALDKLRRDDPDWFTKPLIDSYHTVWFQLHEDLLNTLGIERSQEGSH